MVMYPVFASLSEPVSSVDLLRSIHMKLNAMACGSVSNMVSFTQGDSPSLHLENCTAIAQMPLTAKGDATMALKRLRACIGYNEDGSPIVKQISGNTDLELCDKIVRAVLNSERRFEFIAPEVVPTTLPPAKSKPTFGAYTDKWLKVYKIGKLRPKTLRGYQTIIKVHFLPTWGDTSIDQISVEDVQAFLNERKDHSKKSLQEMLTLLKQILNSAVSDKLIDSNPAADKRIYNPSTAKQERKALTQEQWQDVVDQLDKLKGFDRLYMAIVLFTGMRRGEVLGLQWSDIDLDNNVIHVRRNVTHTVNEAIIGEPKTEKGKRDVPIMEGLLRFLLPLKDHGYIVARDKSPDEPLTFSGFDNMWSRIKETIDLHGATSHVFRHTIGTLLYDNGTDVKTIQSIVGHADYGTTMNTYVHSRDDRKQEAMAKINGKLGA